LTILKKNIYHKSKIISISLLIRSITVFFSVCRYRRSCLDAVWVSLPNFPGICVVMVQILWQKQFLYILYMCRYLQQNMIFDQCGRICHGKLSCRLFITEGAKLVFKFVGASPRFSLSNARVFAMMGFPFFRPLQITETETVTNRTKSNLTTRWRYSTSTCRLTHQTDKI